MTAHTETLREIDALREDIATDLITGGGLAMSIILVRLSKIRAHVDADELERKRLQGEILTSVRGPDGDALFTEEAARHILDLPAGDWRAAPQRARERANAMPPKGGGEKEHGG